MPAYTITAPTPISALPDLPTRGTPDFSVKAHSYLTALRTNVQPEQNNLALNVYNNAQAAHERATTADAAASAAALAALSAEANANAVPWASGGAYVQGAAPSTKPSAVYDPADPSQTYRCILTHSGIATAPGSDPTRWVRLGTQLLRLREAKVTMTGNNIDMDAGAVFTKTVTGNTTFTVSNAPMSGTVGSGLLRLTNAGTYTITFWAGCKWSGGIVPIFTPGGVDEISFYTDDGGVTYWLRLVGSDSK